MDRVFILPQRYHIGRTEKQNPTEFRELALRWLPIFFVRERLKGTEIQFGDLYPIFFLVSRPG